MSASELTLFGVPLPLLTALSALLSFVIAAALLRGNPARNDNRTFFALVCVSILTHLFASGLAPVEGSSLIAQPRFHLTIGLGGLSVYALLLFAYAFPFHRRFPQSLLWGGLCAGLMHLAVNLLYFEQPLATLFSRLYVGSVLLIWLFLAVRNLRRLESTPERVGLVLVHTTLAVRMVLSALTFSVARSEDALEPGMLIFYLIVSPPLFSALIAYGLTRFQALNLRLLLSRSLAYLLTLSAALTLYFGALWLLQGFLKQLLKLDGGSSLTTPVLLIALLVLFHPLQAAALELIERSVDSALARAREATAAYKIHTRRLLELRPMLEALSTTAQRIAPDVELGLLLSRPMPRLLTLGNSRSFVAEDQPAPTALHDRDQAYAFPLGSALLEYFERSRRSHLERSARRALPPDVPDALTRLRFDLAIPLWQENRVEGALLLHTRPLDRERRHCFHELAGHLALQLDNTLLYQQALDSNAALTQSRQGAEDTRLFLESLFESVPAGLAVLDDQGRVSRWNRAMERLTGIEREEALNHHEVLELLPDLAMQVENPEATRRGFTTPLKRRLRLESGEREVVVHMRLALFRDRAGRTGGTVLILTDVTEQMRMQAEVEHSRRLAALGQFAAAMAHELRTPLTSIQMNMQILASKVSLPPEDYEYFDIVLTEIDRLGRTISEILDYARPMRLNLADTVLVELVEEVVRGLYFLLAERGASVRVTIPQSLHLALDGERLKQVLINLLDNASHAISERPKNTASSDERGEIEVRASQISSRDGRPGILLEVQDPGCGIPEGKLEHIFEPFFTTRASGTGLGLAITQKIVEAHRGTIRAESRAGEGSTFKVWLPLDGGATGQ